MVILVNNQVIKLVKEIKTSDEYGNMVPVRTERTVFAELKSIGQSEFYQAQALGLKPEIKFVISDYLDYENEQIVKFADYNSDEEEYSVIRTYRNNNQLELVCKRGIE